MKRCLSYSLIFLFCWACHNDSPQQKSDQIDASPTATTPTLQIHEIEVQAYLAAIRSQASTNIAGLCEESKGYRSKEWQGFNECDWAIEKQLLSEENDRAKRQNKVLSIQMDSEEWLELSPSKPDVSYQYRGYLALFNRYLILIYQPGKCPSFWLINAQDRSRQHIQGHPYFSEDHKAAIVSTAPEDAEHQCNRQLELWQFHDGAFKRKQTSPTQNRIVEKLFWNGQKEILIRQSSPDTQSPTTHYGRIEL